MIILRIVLILVLFLAGCGKQQTISTPTGPSIAHPGKRVPDSSYVPYTQRPYKIKGKTYYPLPSSHGYSEKGVASWYGRKFHGRKTSNSEIYNMYAKTAAHKTLPMNTQALVKNLENGRETVLRINDRGPFVKGRIIDLSLTGAQELGIVKNGTAQVKVTALGEAVTYVQNNKKIKRFLPYQDFNKGNFFVQLGSFTNKENADKLRQKMNKQGKTTVIVEYDREDLLFYRVQVYGGSTLGEAKTMESTLGQQGYSEAFVIAR